MYLCLMYICPDVSKSGGGDVPMSDVPKSAPSKRGPRSGRQRVSRPALKIQTVPVIGVSVNGLFRVVG